MKDHHRIRFWNQSAGKLFYQSEDRGNWFAPEDLPYVGASFNFMELLEAGCIQENCTGLRDKNGVLIYEGDIIRSTLSFEHSFLPHSGSVVYESGSFGTENLSGVTPFYNQCQNTFEIIGNIHQKN